MNRRHLVLACVIGPAATLASALGEHHDEPANHPEPHASPGAAPTELPYDGVVRKIDRKHGKITLKHGPNVNLGMTAMTMEYLAADSKLLNGLKQGDTVRFNAQRLHGAFVLTAIQKNS
jgi:Cu/Ag efflux protein CusF